MTVGFPYSPRSANGGFGLGIRVAFNGSHQRSFFAADKGAGAFDDPNVKVESALEQIVAGDPRSSAALMALRMR